MLVQIYSTVPTNSISRAFSCFSDKYQQHYYSVYKENIPQSGLHPHSFQTNASNDGRNCQLLVSNRASSLNFDGRYHHKEQRNLIQKVIYDEFYCLNLFVSHCADTHQEEVKNIIYSYFSKHAFWAQSVKPGTNLMFDVAYLLNFII